MSVTSGSLARLARLLRSPALRGTAAPGWFALFLAVGVFGATISIAPSNVWAQPSDDEDDDEEEDDEDDDEEDGDDEEPEEEFLGDGPFPGQGRFFFDRPEGPAERKKTKFRGSLTSSSYAFKELSVDLPTGPNGGEGTAQRLFTDLRLRLDAEHLGGGNMGFRADVRGRFLPGSCKINDLENRDNPNTCTRLQSGSFGGNELDLRELFVSRKAGNLELYVGRQFVLDLAAHRLDGAMVRLRSSKKATYLGFVGLHPQKGSRDLRQDYPGSATQTNGESKRIMPVTAGGGLAYRLEGIYGSLGGVLVMPLAEAPETPGTPGVQETPRVFVSGNGYYRVGPRLDFHHYTVLDVVGSAAFALTNMTVGVNAKPAPNLRFTAQVTRVDTETLAATAQTKVANPDVGGGAIQNNIEVLRVASDAARVGISGAFSRRRYELSTNLALRSRPEVTLTQPAAGVGTDVVVVLPAARDVEAMVRFVDRQSFAGFRLGGQVSRNFGIGSDQFQRSSNLVIRADAQKPFGSGKGELDAHVSVISSAAAVADVAGGCGAAAPDQFEACFADSSALTITVGATAFYRLGEKLMAIGSVSLGSQSINSSAAAGTPAAAQGRITPVSAFLRLAYRL